MISPPSVEIEGAKSLNSVFNSETLSTQARIGFEVVDCAVRHSFLRFDTNFEKLSAFLVSAGPMPFSVSLSFLLFPSYFSFSFYHHAPAPSAPLRSTLHALRHATSPPAVVRMPSAFLMLLLGHGSFGPVH